MLDNCSVSHRESHESFHNYVSVILGVSFGYWGHTIHFPGS